MANRRYRSVHTAPPAVRQPWDQPWGLLGAIVALLVYGGVVFSDSGRPASPPPPPAQAVEAPAAVQPASYGPAHRGRASWYGSDFHGSPTASGEPFNMHALTAAHRTLPLGSYARVSNLANGRSVVVKINDRGPHTGRRTIDLSTAAAEELEMVRAGTARVEVAPIAH